ncbi:MAG: bifunctional diaminohydroxyphosphoribosylaminopyrimidine deaminase/5-amino-6-(5-phosphoribosylamino)uracil reductase RibD [Bacteroidales bacterium]
MIEISEKYMHRALQLANSAAETVSPNPMVGAVIVHNGKIIGEGFHRKCGLAHAEVNAVNAVRECDRKLLTESTIYVTLEPCSHYGKTPPCSELIIRCGIPNVVIGCLDPYEKVAGRGVSMLREAGVNVVVGVLSEECERLNKRFVTAHQQKRPYLLLKWAESADGFLDRDRVGRGEQSVISNAVTQMMVHRLRARYDAIMVGSNTVVKDNPTLTVRNWYGDNPIRIVVDRGGIIPTDSNILTDGGETIIFGSCSAEKVNGVEYVKLKDCENPFEEILQELYNRNIISLMVEGGAKLLTSIIELELWDEARIEYGISDFSGGVEAPRIDGVLVSEEFHQGNRVKHLFRR